MPFLIIICLGMIAVLGFQLVKAFFGNDTARAAYMHVISGSAQMKTWGTQSFFDLDGDAVIMQGDQLRSTADARIIIEFFDGTLMRMDGSTSVRFELVNDSKPYIEVDLLEGNVWFNKVYKDTVATSIKVVLDDVTVKSASASVFEVENGMDEVVRVFNVFEKNEGVMVDVLALDEETVVETEKIGIAQEIVFSSAVLERYRAFQSPTVHSGIEDEFENTAWYTWNVAEDKKPTVFEKFASGENAGLVKIEPEKFESDGEVVEPDKPADGATGTRADTEPAITPEPEPKEPAEPVSLGALITPTISSVAGGTQVDANGFYNVSGKLATLTGSVSGAAKVTVNGYTLQKFTPGDSTWTYFANADYGLLKEGENVYEIYAEDAAGKKTEKLVVKVRYTPPAPAPQPAVEPEAPASTTPEASAEPATETESAIEPVSESADAVPVD